MLEIPSTVKVHSCVRKGESTSPYQNSQDWKFGTHSIPSRYYEFVHSSEGLFWYNFGLKFEAMYWDETPTAPSIGVVVQQQIKSSYGNISDLPIKNHGLLFGPTQIDIVKVLDPNIINIKPLATTTPDASKPYYSVNLGPIKRSGLISNQLPVDLTQPINSDEPFTIKNISVQPFLNTRKDGTHFAENKKLLIHYALENIAVLFGNAQTMRQLTFPGEYESITTQIAELEKRRQLYSQEHLEELTRMEAERLKELTQPHTIPTS